jgi:hypothetical protein
LFFQNTTIAKLTTTLFILASFLPKEEHASVRNFTEDFMDKEPKKIDLLGIIVVSTIAFLDI